VAAFGLVVNIVSAWLLGRGGQGQAHHHGRGHGDAHAHRDHNLRAAYLHVLADALTSVLALFALGFGMVFGWALLDPVMGIVGAIFVGRWAWGLAKDSARVLLDAGDYGDTAARIKAAIEGDGDSQLADLHLWRVGPAGRACIVSLVTHSSRSVDHYKSLLADLPGIAHLTVEVNHCQGTACQASPMV
jgi:cation diffusion facilitator family transporter